jgi:hypothetical protein
MHPSGDIQKGIYYEEESLWLHFPMNGTFLSLSDAFNVLLTVHHSDVITE